MEYIYHKPSSKWACAPVIVPKEVSEKYRFTDCLRPFNFKTNVLSIFLGDPTLAKLIGAKRVFQLDLVHEY